MISSRATRFRSRPVARIAAFTTSALTIALVVFHAALFYQRIADATIANGGVLARWIGSFVLLGAFFAFRRRIAAAVARRHLHLAFWLIVILLHAAIPSDQRILASSDVPQ